MAYDGSTGKIAWNKAGSVATAADFASDGKSVTMTLGDRHWSDGKPITSRDVEFWFNLIKANKDAVGLVLRGQGAGQLDLVQGRRRHALHDHVRQGLQRRLDARQPAEPTSSRCRSTPGTRPAPTRR